MNSHSRNHKGSEQKCMFFMCTCILRSRTLYSPMLGCFSKRQILASLSSFWWSKGKAEETQTQTHKQGVKLFFHFLHHTLWWLAFQVIWHEVGCNLVLPQLRTQRSIWACQSVFLLKALCVCWLGVGLLFSWSELKCLVEVMWPDMCLVMRHKRAGHRKRQTLRWMVGSCRPRIWGST